MFLNDRLVTLERHAGHLEQARLLAAEEDVLVLQYRDQVEVLADVEFAGRLDCHDRGVGQDLASGRGLVDAVVAVEVQQHSDHPVHLGGEGVPDLRERLQVVRRDS